ncbi:TPA: transcription elongation factor GreA, partial [Clostridioides difficile]|nr:transcription elongation factor GreA [Clostridioides difficile]
MEENKEFLLTQEGYDKLEEELENLKVVKRKEVAERIKVAISFGDLSENAEYDEAKKEQAQVEERILKLENMVRKAVIIDESKIDLNVVTIGSIVKVKDLEFDEEVEYTIVGSTEADPYDGKISNESPVGK